MNSWTLITVTFNNEKQLIEHWAGVNLSQVSWIVIDNGSSDKSIEIAEQLGAKVFSTGSNQGFAKANNLGLKHAETEFIAFVNPDVTVNTDQLGVLEMAIDDICGFVSPQLLNKDDTFQPNGRGLPFLIDKFANRGLKLPGSRLSQYLITGNSEIVLVDWLMGAVICGRKSHFESLGGWNEKYFLYYEDHAFGLNAWGKGLKVALVTQIEWVHGWERATLFPRFTPWMRELRSAIIFYRSYPELVTKTFRREKVMLGRKTMELCDLGEY